MPDLLPKTEQPINQTTKQQRVDLSIYHLGKKKSPLLTRSVIALVIVIVVIGLAFVTKTILAINSTNDTSGKKVSIFEQISHLIINPEKQLNGEESDRVNILLAGIGGAGHDGAYLADTIIVVSYKPSTNEIATLSIPRDLYVDIPNYGWRKINNALAFGRESDSPGSGEALLAETVSQVIGLPINYYARVDFAGFKKIIDDVGGIDIYVDNSFSDYEYPDYNYGYQHISFTKGWEHMNGERALQFVRSRHGTNGEGSDFARSKRQQKVLFAVKEKALSLRTLTNPASIVSVLNDLGNHNQTNMQIWEMVKLAKIAQNIQKDQVITQVLDTSANGLLKSETTIDGAYILRPKSGDYGDIQYLARNIFDSNLMAKENAVVEIQNSTKQTGLATKIANQLKAMNYNIAKIGNAKGVEPFAKTTIYDLSDGKNPNTLAGLKDTLNADVATVLPSFMTASDITYDTIASQNSNVNATQANTDILIIIGSDLAANSSLTAQNTASVKKNL